METLRFSTAATAACLAAALLATTVPAVAQTGGPGGMPMAAGDAEPPRQSRMMRMLDTSGDGKLTMAEIRAEQKRLLGAADIDGDGKLSADEFRRRGRWFQSLRVTTLFDLIDANGDAALTADELAAPSARWFKRYDANGDGAIVADELPAHRWRGRGPRGRGGPRHMR